MTDAVVFETPGLIDHRSFTTMGLTAKPNSSNPIGRFGTGLKYAVAVLVRRGARLTVWIGRDKHTFARKSGDFRGAPMELIRMKRERFSLTKPTYVELPFTTNYGRDWKVWQAYRELESNTRDEGGRTFRQRQVTGEDGLTRIVVEDLEAYEDRAKTFLEEVDPSSPFHVVKRSSDHIYYRGMRVFDLPNPALFTYNLNEYTPLTEDRTLYGEFQVRSRLAEAVVQSDDEDFIRAVLEADEDHWEHELDLPRGTAPSGAFRRVMESKPKGAAKAYSYYGSWAPERRGRFDLMVAHPAPWRVEEGRIVDRLGNPVLAAPSDYEADWNATAEAVVARIVPKE
jgi:hypothetical protein